MSYALVGPFTFDLKTVVSSGRAALSKVGEALRTGDVDELVESGATATDPGLYVLLEHDGEGGRPAIAGFWFVAGGEYLVGGPLGPPDRVPPYARELLDAATEEVWWQNLEVNLGSDGVWRPVIVLEWPPHMANRSGLAPPGVPFEEEEAADGLLEERETWLEAVDPRGLDAPRTEVPSMSYEKEIDRFVHIDEKRSLVVVVRGTLRHDGRLHQGSFFMVPPELFFDESEASTQVIPLDDWLEKSQGLVQEDVEVLEAQEDERHHLGRPLQLFDDRAGFHSSGWLTRNLSTWPARPSDVTIGNLTDRVVQQKWIAQAWLAVGSSFAVLLVVISFSLLVQYLTRPVPEPMDPPPPPAPQPALSVCSADYQEFVEEFRCQIEHLAGRADDGGTVPVCGDEGSNYRFVDNEYDLQASFCGLLDREVDGWEASLGGSDMANFGLFAASQACFNVLGHPYPYRLRQVGQGGGRVIGDPVQFLEDEKLAIRPLVQLIKELRDSCDAYRVKMESRVEGAIFATHIGSPLGDDARLERGAAKLRRSMWKTAMSSTTSEVQTCFKRGMSEGLGGERYIGYCASDPDRVDTKASKSKIWNKLQMDGRVPEDDNSALVTRYASSRFAAARNETTPLWQCHLQLKTPEPIAGVGRPMGMWEIPIRVPGSYDIVGRGVRTQLSLDAALTAFEDGVDAGVCWGVVAKRLSVYKPVHPLLAELEPEGWPTDEQQLCGQICAAGLNIKKSPNDSQWVTRELDLEQCVTQQRGPVDDMGRGTLDVLRLPWNEVKRGEWVEPPVEHVCAFNVVAQDLMPQLEEGYVIGGRAPKEFAGETVSGSRIVGGREGLAARYVKGLAFARRDSVSSVAACGHVATQCFTSVLLEITGDTSIERYRWKEEWKRRIEGMQGWKRAQLAEEYPWCVGLKDYLIPERETAQFDAPCVAGVVSARANTEAALTVLQSDVTLGGE